MHVLVAGGGVIGCSIAYYLRRAGADVTLVERQRIGAGASSAAAGMLAPLAESSDPGPFLGLALKGLEAFDSDSGELTQESGVDFEFRRDGVLRVAESADEEARLRNLVALQSQAGLEARWLNRPELAALEPLLAPAVNGALYSPREGHLNPGRLTAALADAALRRGARLIEGQEVETFEREGSRILALRTRGGRIGADQFVLAGGAWTEGIAAGLGTTLPVSPVRGQMVALRQTAAP